MNTLTSIVDRIIIALIGILLVVSGLVIPCTYAFGYKPSIDFVDALTSVHFSDWPYQNWWRPVILGMSLLLFLCSVLLFHINRPRRAPQEFTASVSNERGTVTIALQPVAAALAEDLRTVPKVRTTRCHLVEANNAPVFDLTVISSPNTELPTLIGKTEECASELSSTTEEAGIALRTFLQFDPYRPERR